MTQTLMMKLKRAWRMKEGEDRKATPCVFDPERKRIPSSDGKLSQPVRERKKMGQCVWGFRRSGLLEVWVPQSCSGGWVENFDGWTLITVVTRCASVCRALCLCCTALGP